MKNKFKPILSVLLVLTMLLGLLAAFPLTTSAAINAVWWTDASDMTDFTASINTEWVSSSSWYRLQKYDEASEQYVQVRGACGYVGTNGLDFETAIHQNGSGEKEFAFTGALDAPQNLRWVGETVRWEPVEGADRYDITLRYKKNESSDQIWSTSYTYGNTYSVDFSGQLSNPGSYYFTVEASSTDEMLVSSSAKSPEKTVSYTYSDLNAHWGDVSRDQRKYMLYWNNVPDATGYYMVLSKKNGEAYQPVSGFDNKLSKLTGLDLYAVMEANGEGDYKVDFFAFNTSPTIRVSNEVSIEITFTNCVHSYTKEIQTSYYNTHLECFLHHIVAYSSRNVCISTECQGISYEILTVASDNRDLLHGNTGIGNSYTVTVQERLHLIREILKRRLLVEHTYSAEVPFSKRNKILYTENIGKNIVNTSRYLIGTGMERNHSNTVLYKLYNLSCNVRLLGHGDYGLKDKRMMRYDKVYSRGYSVINYILGNVECNYCAVHLL